MSKYISLDVAEAIRKNAVTEFEARIAEKDAEIARLEAQIQEWKDVEAEVATLELVELRKVSDAQRDELLSLVADLPIKYGHDAIVQEIVAIIESPADVEK